LSFSFQSSGVKVAPECLEAFQSLKLGKKIKFIIFKLSKDNTEIVVSKTSESQDYDEFLEYLVPGECCYAIYDVHYQKGEEGMRNKICFYTW
jgi:cofilin